MVKQLIEHYKKTGKVDRGLLLKLLEQVEGGIDIEELKARIQNLLSQLEGLDCEDAQRVMVDLQDALDYLEQATEQELMDIIAFVEELEKADLCAEEEEGE